MRTPQMNQMENKEVMAMKKEKMKRMGVVTRTRETIVMNPPKKKKSKIKKKYRMILRKSVKSSRSFMSKIRLWTILQIWKIRRQNQKKSKDIKMRVGKKGNQALRKTQVKNKKMQETKWSKWLSPCNKRWQADNRNKCR